MAKSSYLDNLINNKLPKNVYEDRYMSELWNIVSALPYSSYRNSLVNNLSDDKIIAITGSDYLNNLNTNQTVLDMQSSFLSKITLDDRYLPVKKIEEGTRTIGDRMQGLLSTNMRVPANYLPASITAYKGGAAARTIQVLFPASFSRSISSSFAKENPVGSTKPIMAFSYTDAEEIPFEFDALADYLPEPYTTLKSYVDDILDILKPGKSGNVIYEPTVIVQFADMKFSGVCTSVNIAYDNVYNYKSFVHAKISCQFIKLGD